MQFDYDKYCRMLLWTPLIFDVFMLYGFYVAIYNYLKLEDKLRKYLLICVTTIGLVCILWSDSGKKLYYGSIYLPFESVNDAIHVEGKVASIEETSDRFNGFKSSYGADIVVEGYDLFIEDTGDLKEGDTVEVTFLPKSHCVLEIIFK